MNVLDAAIQAALVADTGAGGVATLSTGGMFQAKAPQGTVPPYTLWQEASDFPQYAFGNVNQADHMFYAFRAFAVDDPNVTLGSGPFRAGTISDRLKVLFTNPSLTVTGKILLSARFDRSLPPLEEWDGANNRYIWMRGILCEVWIGPVTVPAVAATGTLSFTPPSSPADGNTLTVNGAVFTFKDTPTTTHDIQRDADRTIQATNTATTLNASTDPLVSVASYSAISTAVTITHDTPGAAGNAFTLAISGTKPLVSGATLTGGTDAS